MNKFMEIAKEEALLGVKNGDGGPFGAVITRGDEIISRGHNEVLKTNDPTMHAEVVAIRKACATLGRFSLDDCEIYSSCMPCPMCLGAIMWAKIPTLYYALSATDAAKIGFDDKYIYDFIKNDFNLKGENKLSLKEIDANDCKELFDLWENRKNKDNNY